MDDLTPKNAPSPDPTGKPCPLCGGSSFTWGRTVGQGPSEYIYFRAESGSWGDGKRMYARECDTCGNVQLFTKQGG